MDYCKSTEFSLELNRRSKQPNKRVFFVTHQYLAICMIDRIWSSSSPNQLYYVKIE